MPPAETPIVVVGAGAAGLAVGAELRRGGLEPVLLDADERVGGSWARRYDRLHLHTVGRFSALPGTRLPRALPRYVSKDDYADYLAAYAREHALDVRLGRRVERVERSDGRWLVRAGEHECLADVVVIATGKHGRPFVPEWPGRGEFGGELVHAADYRSARPYAGKRVLVVGIGNSGAEIATDLVDGGAASVAIAVRTTPPIAKRDIFGLPVQLYGIALSPFPARAVDRVGAVVRRLGTGDLRRYGLGDAAWGPFVARRPPLIDVGFLAALKHGSVTVRPAVARLTPAGVVFADGSEEEVDAVVAATGYTTGLESFVGGVVLDEDGLPRAARDGSTAEPGLYFAGFRESPRGALYEINRDAPRVAASIARFLAA